MREIKFRQWKDGRMSPFGFLKEKHGGVSFTCAQNNRIDKYPVMQFTGLRDCNGADIYEGDVVYLGGYGNYICEFPFLELYDSVMEDDIGSILGNIHQNKELLK